MTNGTITEALQPDALWLSRPPYLLIARITSRAGPYGPFRYELLDRDGSVLIEQVDGRLDDEWWHCYQPLTPRYG